MKRIKVTNVEWFKNTVKWNGGEGAILCAGKVCRTIVALGFDRPILPLYCDKCQDNEGFFQFMQEQLANER